MWLKPGRERLGPGLRGRPRRPRRHVVDVGLTLSAAGNRKRASEGNMISFFYKPQKGLLRCFRQNEITYTQKDCNV